MYDKRKALIAALNAVGFNRGSKLSVSQISEIEKIMKDEYGIEVKIQKDNELETLKKSIKEFTRRHLPAPGLDPCDIPKDGKARRRERRKKERMKRKNK